MSAQKNHSGLALNESDKLNAKVSVALTERDLLLLKLCLKLVDRHYVQKGTLSFEVQRLRDKLSKEQQALVGATQRSDRDECKNR